MAISQPKDLAMLAITSLGGYAAVLMLLTAFLYILRQLALPKPIPGIPYDPESATKILGDLPAIARTSDMREWAVNHGIKLQSPIFQVFMRPFTKPYVFITDFSEMADISMRRMKEFDRSDDIITTFHGIMPEQQISLHSADPKFKRNRELVRDLMSPSFLNNVSAPHIYSVVLRVMTLWEKKLAICKDRPFDIGDDIHYTMLDMTLLAAFGMDVKRTQLVKQLSSLQPKTTSSWNDEKKKDAVFEFEHVPLDPELAALTTLSESVKAAFRAPFIRLHHFIQKHFSSTMKNAHSLVDKLRHREIAASLERRKNGQAERSALDHMIAREAVIAEKEGRKPNYYCQALASEVLGYLLAGHETTSAAIRWGVKYINSDQRVQATLQQALKTAYSAAASENRLPTLSEILKTNVPYLDAVIEEALRCGKVAPQTIRQALVDTHVLGVPILKGTSVCLMGNGPGCTIPSTAVPFDEKKYSRGEGAKMYLQKYGQFDDVGIESYYPERWLKKVTGENGEQEVEFDAYAGPIFAFGLGPRGCFGRKLAYMKLRLFFTLVFLNFEFGEIPSELAGHEHTVFLTRAPNHVFVKLQKV